MPDGTIRPDMTPADTPAPGTPEPGPPAIRPPRTQPREAGISAGWQAWRFLGIAHAGGLVIFIVMMAGFLWYVSHIEKQEQRAALLRDTDWAQQSLKLSLRELQEHLARVAPLWLGDGPPAPQQAATRGMPRVPRPAGSDHPSGSSPSQTPAGFLAIDDQTRYLALISTSGQVRTVITAPGVLVGQRLEAGEPRQDGAVEVLPGFESTPDDAPRRLAWRASIHTWKPHYSPPLMVPGGEVMTELYLPVIQERHLVGVAVVGIGLEALLQTVLPENLRQRYRFALVDGNGRLLASTSSVHRIDASTAHMLPLDPPGNGLMLRAIPYAGDTPGLAERLTQLGLFTLATISVLSLILLWRSAHDRLRVESERDRLFELSQDVFCTIRPDGTLVRGNPAFVEYFGKDLANTRFWDHVYPEDRLDVIEAFTTPQERIGPLECRVRFRNAWRWLSWSISVDTRSPESLYYAVAHDITGRKLVEQALTTEATFRRAIEDSISTGLRVIDNDGRITYVNRALCQILGYPAEELVGQLPPYPYWIPEEYDLNMAHLNMTIAGGAPPSGIQTRARRKDGRIIDVRLYLSPLIDDQGQQAGWMASATDITEPNRIRAELEAAHERFNTVLNQLDAAVSVVSPPPPAVPLAGAAQAPSTGPEPTLMFCNYHYHRLFGDDINGHLALLRGWPVADSWVGEEVYIADVDRWFEVRTQQIRWVDGQVAQLLVATDITALRPIRERQRQQEEQLQQTSRLVTMGEMASSIAHELNQPLAAISNYATGLIRRMQPGSPAPVDNARIAETLDKIARQAQRAASVIQRVRDFVRRQTAEQRDISVDEILTEALALAEIAAKRYGVAITIDVAPDLPRLSADRILIEQVLLNLLKNAIDAMRGQNHAALTLRVNTTGESVVFSVADQGPGIADEMKHRVFEPFFTTKNEGMGMGLNICRTIIESHAGRLWVEDNKPRGTVFRFTLPVNREGAADAEGTKEAENAGDTGRAG
jgi:putative sensor hybrid histidine kinase